MKKLFILAEKFTFSPRSKVSIILSEGAMKHSEVELAKALTTTVAYKKDAGLRDAVLNVLDNAVKNETKHTERTSNSEKSAEPERRRY